MANIIFSKFLKLNQEKQERILNAAMKEFAQKGYKNASTDAIVKDAAISKGALFHYFKNKKDLFLYLYDYAMEIFKDEILLKYNNDEKDIFSRIRELTLLKFEILKKHPEMYDFIAAAYMEDSAEVKSDLHSRNKVLIKYGESILNVGIDTTKFNEDIEAQKAIDIITWAIEGFSNKQIDKVKNFSSCESNLKDLILELDIYLNTLRKCFYKND